MDWNKRYFRLLQQWCDALLAHQLRGTGLPALDGGIYCDACARVHGRSYDAVYPLLYLADATGEMRYLEGAKALMQWSEALCCDDGSYYNDHNSEWNGTTVFFAIALCEALTHHGHVLDKATKTHWEKRLRGMGNWLYARLNRTVNANINYFVTNSAALALLGRYFQNEIFLAKAKEWAHFSLRFISGDGILTGEGHPMDGITPRGCRAVDIGYNVEESLPMLALYARVIGDDAVMEKALHALRAHLAFLLPDGGWDNSFGSRNFKWSYWGSRTSDGFQTACAAAGDLEHLLIKAAQLNLQQYEACTQNGLLYGGPHYASHGEPPCIHHSFCHAKALASVLDAHIPAIPEDTQLPIPPALMHYADMDIYKIHQGGFYATVSCNDVDYVRGGQACGGTMTLLWHEKTGPIIASSMCEYSLKEMLNMQLTRNKQRQGSLTPRIALGESAQCYDTNARVSCQKTEQGVTLAVEAVLCTINREPDAEQAGCVLEYHITPQIVVISGKVQNQSAHYILPLIGLHQVGMDFSPGLFRCQRGRAALVCRSAQLQMKPRPVFSFAGGFEAWELRLQPDESGSFRCEITIEEFERKSFKREVLCFSARIDS